MTVKRAIEVLTEYNKWRRHTGDPCPFKFSGLELGAAIDVAIHCMWKFDKMSEITREPLTLLSDITDAVEYFFGEDVNYDEKGLEGVIERF